MASGKVGQLAMHHKSGSGCLDPWPDSAWSQIASDDQTGVVGATLRGGTTMLLVGSANYETADGHIPAARQFIVRGKQVFAAAEVPRDASSSTGPLAMADIDGDGTLEV